MCELKVWIRRNVEKNPNRETFQIIKNDEKVSNDRENVKTRVYYGKIVGVGSFSSSQ